MDSAVRIVPTAAPRLVTAEELSRAVNARYGGTMPSGMRFHCPYCGRPVTAAAMGRRKTTAWRGRYRSGRRSPSAWTQSPHFRHARNDEAARRCEHYKGGEGQEQRHPTPPPLLMLLRRERAQRRGHPRQRQYHQTQHAGGASFRIEVRLRRRGMVTLRSQLREGDAIDVEGRPYSVLRQVTDRRASIVLRHPDFAMRNVMVPERWQRFVGRPQGARGNAFVFSDAFGDNGGRRLADGAAVRTGVDYYVVADSRAGHQLGAAFDVARQVGVARGAERGMAVWRVRVAADSRRWESADGWLSSHGLHLSDYDASAQLVWPPSLRSAGVDEPLFADANPLYRNPVPTESGVVTDYVDRRHFGDRTSGSGRDRFRSVGFVGFGRDLKLASELEASCLFVRPGMRMPWNAVVIGRFRPGGLAPADAVPGESVPQKAPAEVHDSEPEPAIAEPRDSEHDDAVAVAAMPGLEDPRHDMPDALTVPDVPDVRSSPGRESPVPDGAEDDHAHVRRRVIPGKGVRMASARMGVSPRMPVRGGASRGLLIARMRMDMDSTAKEV